MTIYKNIWPGQDLGHKTVCEGLLKVFWGVRVASFQIASKYGRPFLLITKL